MTSDKARQNLRNVLVVAIADGKVTGEEKQCIASLRKRLGMTNQQLNELCREVRKSPREVFLPKDRQEAVEAANLMAEIALADGNISQAERAVLAKIAYQAGLDDSELEAIICAHEGAAQVRAGEMEQLVEDIYEGFQSWGTSTRQKKLDAICTLGSEALVPLLRVFESYRKPDGADSAIELKIIVAGELATLADSRSAYYLAQQITVGDSDDEITSPALRATAVAALGACVGESFPPGDEGVAAARAWWLGGGGKEYNRLAF